MNTSVLQHQYAFIASILYIYTLNTVDNIVEFLNKSLVMDKDYQHNAAPFWIIVLIVLIVGGLVLAGLMWACNKFGGGAKFDGKFEVLGAKVRIRCS
ncbi:hypothetical protein ACFSKI_21920 [Pseudogracilibacillus auburnensis]|uniref:Uncharacterized protein n=1 Tax=Pseudogracilibacillus auburnensis TaxID=1494959 RepID=A0A2V3VZ53_9BACI|nr:hypothetical protein [Pseudogracilibacillus auburnensis]PXW85255.1 hypothetical protein DFR56_11121 [Pseudogracilibacillus auburnensis]